MSRVLARGVRARGVLVGGVLPTHHILELPWGALPLRVLPLHVLLTVAPKFDGWGVLLRRVLPLHVLDLQALVNVPRILELPRGVGVGEVRAKGVLPLRVLPTVAPQMMGDSSAPKYDGWEVLLLRALPLHVLPLVWELSWGVRAREVRARGVLPPIILWTYSREYAQGEYSSGEYSPGGILPPIIFWRCCGEYVQGECSQEEYSHPSFVELPWGVCAMEVRAKGILAREILLPIHWRSRRTTPSSLQK